MDPQQIQTSQLRLLLKSMGVSVQQNPQTRPARRPHPPNPAFLLGLGFIFVIFMILRAPNVMVDFVQMLRTGAIALMMVSGTMIFADLCLSQNKPERIEAAPEQPHAISGAFPAHQIAFGPDGRRYAMVALDSTEAPVAAQPCIEHSEPHEEALPVEEAPSEATSSAAPSPTPSEEMGQNSNEE